jgi:hypothetical protein
MACGECVAIQGSIFGNEDEVEGVGADGIDGFVSVAAVGMAQSYESEENRRIVSIVRVLGQDVDWRERNLAYTDIWRGTFDHITATDI